MVKHAALFAPVNAPDVVAAKAQALRDAAGDLGGMVLITIDEAADLIGVRRGLLARWRAAQEGPAYFKIGRDVLYELERVLAFIEMRRARLQNFSG